MWERERERERFIDSDIVQVQKFTVYKGQYWWLILLVLVGFITKYIHRLFHFFCPLWVRVQQPLKIWDCRVFQSACVCKLMFIKFMLLGFGKFHKKNVFFIETKKMKIPMRKKISGTLPSPPKKADFGRKTPPKWAVSPRRVCATVLKFYSGS